MKFIIASETDVGTQKDKNQDSILIEHALTRSGEVLMAIVCDGMGGLSQGELASATVIREFARWFREELPAEATNPDVNVIASKWEHMLKTLNMNLMEYGRNNRISLGTTFSGILFIEDFYLIAHIGDSRVYKLTNALWQLTEDHTLMNRELKKGNITPEEIESNPKRNVLLQCVGASKIIEPQFIDGKTEPCTYLLCSDGFRHKINGTEIYQKLSPYVVKDEKAMKEATHNLISTVKSRNERDNISAIVIKAE